MLKKIIKRIKKFINDYIVSEDPNGGYEEKIFKEKLKEFDEWQTPPPPKKKRGRPNKK